MTQQGPDRLFDPRGLRLHRRRSGRDFARYRFLFDEVGARLLERLEDVRRRFPVAAELGSRSSDLGDKLLETGRVGTLLRCAAVPTALSPELECERPDLVAEDERLPFAAESLDLVLSPLTLHWINDLPGLLLQIRQVLRPDGLLLAALFGGDTLTELREALLLAESECEGGASPRVAPFADLRDLGSLLQRAGLALPVADSDSITVSYDNAFALMRDLRGMGETNALQERRRSFSRRATLLRAAEIYRDRHSGADGRIVATYQVSYLTAWAPHEAQPKALRPGTAEMRLADALGAKESPAGDKARPG